MELTDAQWEIVGPILTARAPGKYPSGRKSSDAREVLEGVLWI